MITAVAIVLLAAARAPSLECQFVSWWAAKARHISQEIQLAEERWYILPDGYSAENYATIIEIKREAYHDLPALAIRVKRACAGKTSV